jgi:hypothetical protein
MLLDYLNDGELESQGERRKDQQRGFGQGLVVELETSDPFDVLGGNGVGESSEVRWVWAGREKRGHWWGGERGFPRRIV